MPRDNLRVGEMALFLYSEKRANEIARRVLAGWEGHPKIIKAIADRAIILLTNAFKQEILE